MGSILTSFRERFLPRSRPVVINAGSGIEWVIDPNIGNTSEVYQIENHLRLAEISKAGGVDLLTFDDIIKELGEENFDSWVLFDTPANIPIPGNSWRVLELDRIKRITTLAFTGPVGGWDLDCVLPFKVPFDSKFFTGVIVHHYLHNETGETLPLSEVIRMRQEGEWSNITKQGKAIYWSSGAGPYLGLIDYKYITPSGEKKIS